MRGSRQLLLFLLIFAVLVGLHAPLLSLPYFWDEAGYYIPAAHDLYLSGALIPKSTLLTGHPPLLSAYLAVWWKVVGYAPTTTRVAMLAVAAFGLLQFYLLGLRLRNRAVSIAATLLVTVYPVFFAQSSLAHADLAATALTLWGLRLYLEQVTPWRIGLAFCVAVLAKETAVLVPGTLLVWEFAGRILPERARWDAPRRTLSLLVPIVVLGIWYAFVYSRTGHVFGDASFMAYNAGETLNPLRFVLAALQRTWQVFGHMNLWVLTLFMGAAMLLPAVKDEGVERKRIAVPVQLLFLSIVGVHVGFHSVLGGALLSRYLLPVVPLVILVAVSTLERRFSRWKWLAGFAGLCFVVGWFVNPPYRFAPEDNLNYADFVRAHQHAIWHIEQHHANAVVGAAWPASDEMSKPELGYVGKPLKVLAVDRVAFDDMGVVGRLAAADVVLVFSRKYEPARPWFRWDFWQRSTERFFDYQRDIPPELVAQMLGGRIVFEESRNDQWVAVVEVERIENAKVDGPSFMLHISR
jgi:hypothetical protein